MTPGSLTADTAPAPALVGAGAGAARSEARTGGPLGRGETREASRRLHLRAAARTAWQPLATCVLIGLGFAARVLFSGGGYDHVLWYGGLALTGTSVVWSTLRGALRGYFAADVVATLAIVAAALLGEPLVGLVIVLMQTGGEALERYAEGRASDAVRGLEAAAPRIAHRLSANDVADCRAEDVTVGDLLLIRPGELVPCDAVVIEGSSHVDASMLTGEPLPVSAARDTHLLSGSANLDGPLTVRALATARESQYARIVALVRSAQASKAPLQRVADRYAVWFTPLTLLVCGVTYTATGDWLRVLAVLAVATPCPLILATPVAIIGGLNRAARRQIMRHGTALERLGTTTVAVFDKTGTITIGQPRVRHVVTAPGYASGEVLRLAGAVERFSGHLLARTLVEAAEAAGLTLPPARDVIEVPGRGVTGTVDGHHVVVGARAFVLEQARGGEATLPALEPTSTALRAYVAVDHVIVGTVEYADALRPGLSDVFRDLRTLGVRRIMLLSGDHGEAARAVAASAGIVEVQGDLLPEGKVAAVRSLIQQGESVLMVGDGTNDAPALSAATVGVALAGHGGGITAEAADVVVLIDDLSRVPEAMRVSRHTMHIARQCIGVGLGLSAMAMMAAAMGMVTPTNGALLQEAIDLAVILNALRASR